MDNRDVAKRWFWKGNNDIASFNNLEAPRIHGLEELISMCVEIDPEFSNLYDIGSDLSGYAVEVRYPTENDYEITIEETKHAVEIAEKIKKFIMNKLKLS